MAIDKYTVQISKEIRVVILGHLEDTTRRLVEAWSRAWDELDQQWQLVIADLIQKSTNGKWPSPAEIRRASQVLQALEATHAEILRLGDLGGVLVVEKTKQILANEQDWMERLTRSQLPDPTKVDLAIGFNRVDADAIGAIVERATEQIHSYTKPLADDAVDSMKNTLIRGVALGDNPRQAAATIVRRVEGRFNGGLTRALNIARTETLDAHRSGAAAAQFANPDVLRGWLWDAELDTRTCPSCWAQHGTEHGLDEPGPNDHQQGRCARLPLARTWSDLGFDVAEPPSLFPDAETTFRALPEAKQLEIMGPKRLAALNAGGVSWKDLSMRRSTDGWRDSYVPRPVGKL